MENEEDSTLYTLQCYDPTPMTSILLLYSQTKGVKRVYPQFIITKVSGKQ